MNGLNKQELTETVDRLEEIQGEMLELLGEAKELVRGCGVPGVESRANAYWLAHVAIALTKNSEYMNHSMCDMDDTIKELREELEEGCEDEW